MKIENLKMTLLKVEKKEGVGKVSKKPYLFYSALLVDEDANPFAFNLSEDLAKTVSTLMDVRNKDCVVSINLFPSGFTIGAQLVALKLSK